MFAENIAKIYRSVPHRKPDLSKAISQFSWGVALLGAKRVDI